MQKKILFVAAFLMVLLTAPAQALNRNGSGQAETVADKVNRKTTWNKLADSMATLGKDKQHKTAIEQARQEQRRIKRLQAIQHKKELEAARRQKAIESEMNRLKKKGSLL